MARSDVCMTSAAHSCLLQLWSLQATTTTIAQHSPGPSVVMSSQKPMVTTSGNILHRLGRPEEHSRPIPASSSENNLRLHRLHQHVVHPITTSPGKQWIQKLFAASTDDAGSSSKQGTSGVNHHSGHSIPPAHMHLSHALEKEQHMRTMAAMHNQPMMHLMGQPHVMTNHIQHKPEKTPKGNSHIKQNCHNRTSPYRDHHQVLKQPKATVK
ncbi:unnamed protein product [Mytilus edulis]|uniref:Uncharacterized protein n=1 Tax=Mytilus edulis TaxID=6550 RepID=A0A8S3R5B5_MYTED|nr:unnamed protein product [Mytilus edulis]